MRERLERRMRPPRFQPYDPVNVPAQNRDAYRDRDWERPPHPVINKLRDFGGSFGRYVGYGESGEDISLHQPAEQGRTGSVAD